MKRKENSEELRRKYITRKILHYTAQIDMGSRTENVLMTLEAFLTAEKEMKGMKIGNDEAERAESFFRSEAEYFRNAEDIARETTWAIEYAERAMICEETAERMKKCQIPETERRRVKS